MACFDTFLNRVLTAPPLAALGPFDLGTAQVMVSYHAVPPFPPGAFRRAEFGRRVKPHFQFCITTDGPRLYDVRRFLEAAQRCLRGAGGDDGGLPVDVGPAVAVGRACEALIAAVSTSGNGLLVGNAAGLLDDMRIALFIQPLLDAVGTAGNGSADCVERAARLLHHRRRCWAIPVFEDRLLCKVVERRDRWNRVEALLERLSSVDPVPQGFFEAVPVFEDPLPESDDGEEITVGQSTAAAEFAEAEAKDPMPHPAFAVPYGLGYCGVQEPFPELLVVPASATLARCHEALPTVANDDDGLPSEPGLAALDDASPYTQSPLPGALGVQPLAAVADEQQPSLAVFSPMVSPPDESETTPEPLMAAPLMAAPPLPQRVRVEPQTHRGATHSTAEHPTQKGGRDQTEVAQGHLVV